MMCYSLLNQCARPPAICIPLGRGRRPGRQRKDAVARPPRLQCSSATGWAEAIRECAFESKCECNACILKPDPPVSIYAVTQLRDRDGGAREASPSRGGGNVNRHALGAGAMEHVVTTLARVYRCAPGHL